MPPRNRETAERIEFRLRQHEQRFADRLAEAAREAGRTPSDHARELLKDALTRDEQLQHSLETIEQELAQLHKQVREFATIKDAMRAIHENIYQMRDDLATCVAKLLADAGGLTTEAAEQWTRACLNAR